MSGDDRFFVLKDFVSRVSKMHPAVLMLVYVVAYATIELFVDNAVRLYIYNVFLALSGIYFAWFTGGKLTAFYVAFFNVFIVFIFSKLMWGWSRFLTPQVFMSRTFLAIYFIAIIFLVLMLRRRSPADKRQEEQQSSIDQEKKQRQNLEFMVASRKLKQDLLAQANLVKDELQLLEGAWRSNIHDIINDLTPVREQELYRQIILPFQNNIIDHLRDLEMHLTFDIQNIKLFSLAAFLQDRIATVKMAGATRIIVEAQDWIDSDASVHVDKNKIWDMLLNIVRNSQTALDLQRLDALRNRVALTRAPTIHVQFLAQGKEAQILVRDNGGGVAPEIADVLFRVPVPSQKRGGKDLGQGTLFVKFFADRMAIAVTAQNVVNSDVPGLDVCLFIPYALDAEATAGDEDAKPNE